MCGITGLVRFDGTSASRGTVEAMTDAIPHRGPNDEGVHVDGPTGLGNRRLAVLDLSEAGHQPMTTPDERYTITYNGEVYNYEEIRARLRKLGHTFDSDSDTEVVLHAYAEWGADALERFQGMFAFAIWDAQEDKLFLARDRYGVKPLYVAADENCLFFGSEVKSLLASGEIDRRVDRRALREYFTFQNIYSDRTLLDGVRTVPPGHHVTVDVPSGELEEVEYWDYDFTDKLDPDEVSRDECAAEVRARFEQAVERQLVSDVPVGSYLSGGMDSGSIVAVASRKLPRLTTVTGGFDVSDAEGLEADFDERGAAERMARTFDTQHVERYMHAGDAVDNLGELAWHLEVPRVGMCWQNFHVHDLASRFVTVVLSGAGGDELFGGYPWRYERVRDADTPDEAADAYFDYWQRLIPQADHGSFFTDAVLDETDDFEPREAFDDVLEDAPVRDEEPLDLAFYFELKTFLPGLFTLADKLSMARSLEIRVPFLDRDLVDYATKIPPEYKVTSEDPDVEVEGQDAEIADDVRVSNEGKRVLRDAMRGLIPDEIVERDKQGFSTPDGTWYRTENREYVEELLLDERTLERGYLQPDAIRRVVRENSEGEENHRLLIWSLILFEHWCREFLDGEPDRSPAGGRP